MNECNCNEFTLGASDALLASDGKVHTVDYCLGQGEIAEQCMRSERNGILMLIAHLRDLLEPDTGAARQLESLHKMISENRHQNYTQIAILEAS